MSVKRIGENCFIEYRAYGHQPPRRRLAAAMKDAKVSTTSTASILAK